MLEKAQGFKRKWNMEDQAGMKSKSHTCISKTSLISVAKELNVIGADGNPQALDNMISLNR